MTPPFPAGKLRCAWLLTLLSVLVLPLRAQFSTAVTPPRYEIRAVWLTTLQNLDWPTRPATTPAGEAEQRQELCDMLDKLKAAGINTVIMQARIRSTTIYPSSIEPWDACLTGKAGRGPGYDPLAFAVEECHRRGLELHAWVVAFPICKALTAKQLGAAALPRRRPELCQLCGDQWMMDPGVPATADYVASICEEIVRNYDVDGINLDYIRYPERSIPFNDNKTYQKYGYGQNKAQWRRDNVTRTVRAIHDRVRALKPWVKLSCSPVGKFADLPLHSSRGWNARDAVSQDAVAWLDEGLMDWLLPMMYFTGDHFYPFAADWMERADGKPVAPGLGIYFLSPKEKNWSLDVVTREMNFLRYLGAGQAYFRTRFLLDNEKGLYDYARRHFYATPARIPPMKRAGVKPPDAPRVRLKANAWSVSLSWNATDGAYRYNIYRADCAPLSIDSASIVAQGLKETTFTYSPALPQLLGGVFAVTAVDRYGQESQPSIVQAETVAAPSGIVGTLRVPQFSGADSLLIADPAGRILRRLRAAEEIDVSALRPGWYTLYVEQPDGMRKQLQSFWKE